MGKAMSQICNKKQQQALKEEKELEIRFNLYESTLDGIYSKIEKNYNVLQYIQLHEFILLLSNLKVEELIIQDTTNSSNRGFNQEINKLEFQIFVENKIFKNFLISSLIENDESRTNADIFQEYLVEIFSCLIQAKIERMKMKNPQVKIKKGSVKTIKKLFLFPLAFFLCAASDKMKLDIFFSLFVDDKNNFNNSEDLEDFLYFLFITQSTLGLMVIQNLSEKYPLKLKLSGDEFLAKSGAVEVKDITRLMVIFLESFFKGKKGLSKTEYESKFVNVRGGDDFGWIFTASGVRSHLEKHDDVAVEVDVEN